MVAVVAVVVAAVVGVVAVVAVAAVAVVVVVVAVVGWCWRWRWCRSLPEWAKQSELVCHSNGLPTKNEVEELRM